MKNKDIVILEGFHVCKHAVRFGADIVELVTPNKILLEEMLIEHAPDVSKQILGMVQEISQEEFATYSNILIRTPLAGKANIPGTNKLDITDLGPVVLLDNPRDLENIGAVVRLAAGMDCAGVITTGDVDPWHKNCLRGSQGLHFALPVVHIDSLGSDFLTNKYVVAFDERGSDIRDAAIIKHDNLVLAFGSERAGMCDALKEKASAIVKIPQREGVASYNLATSVAMGVYHYKITI